ncbi:MAG: hypothetical protein ACJ763_16135 [Bdellovibrionia bacterium]
MRQIRHWRLACWLGTLASLSAVSAFGESPLPQLLHNLNAGTKLVAKQPIIIPANTDQITFANRAAPGSICRLRVKESVPFDRVLPADQALTVAGTSRGGFSSSRRSSLSTYVRFNSHAIDDFVCTADRGAHEMTVGEFSQLLAGDFLIRSSERPPTVID